MKLKVGDHLFEPLSGNSGEITKLIHHPDGRLVTIRWQVDGHLAHETEHFYARLKKCIQRGEMQHSPAPEPE